MIYKKIAHYNHKFGTLLHYIIDGMDKSEAKRLVYFHNLAEGFEPSDNVKEFEKNAEYLKNKSQNSSRKRIYKTHEILSFAKDSFQHLSREKLQKIISIYLRLRDPENMAKALCTVHWDSHIHIHVILQSNYIASDRSDLWQSNNDFYEIRRNLERETLAEFPELLDSTVYLEPEEVKKIVPEKYHDQIRDKNKSQKDFGKQTKKQAIANIVRDIMDKATSLADFQQRLENSKNLKPYFRNENLSGVIVDRKKYRLKTLGIELLPERLNVLSRLNELEKIQNKKERENGLER